MIDRRRVPVAALGAAAACVVTPAIALGGGGPHGFWSGFVVGMDAAGAAAMLALAAVTWRWRTMR